MQAPFRSRLTFLSSCALLGALLVTGCTKAEPKATNATPTAPASSSSAVSSTPPRSSSARPTPTPTVTASFSGTCDDLLPVTTLDDAFGRPVIGRTVFIVGVAEPNIGRLAYLNCKYGISTVKVKKKPVTTTKVEIGISLYKTNEQANRRVSGTIEDYRSHGATSVDTPVGEYAGTILLGSGDPTLVVAAGPRTVAVTMAPSFVAAASRNQAMVAAANLAIKATGTFNQGGPAAGSSDSSAASPSTSAS